MNPHFGKDQSLILKVGLKIAIFAFNPEKIGQQDISP